jgi:hypothetical protein
MKNIKLTKIELEDVKSTLREMVSELYLFDDISERIKNYYLEIDSFRTIDYFDIIDFLLSLTSNMSLSDIELYEYERVLDPKSLYKWDKFNEEESVEFKNLLIKEYGFEESDFE